MESVSSWVRSLRELSFVGTESRLNTIFGGLRLTTSEQKAPQKHGRPG